MQVFILSLRIFSKIDCTRREKYRSKLHIFRSFILSLHTKRLFMKEIILNTVVKVCTYDELSAADTQLVDAAREAAKKSYAPYSRFNVGAAVLLDSGEIVTGSNQENAAYPSHDALLRGSATPRQGCRGHCHCRPHRRRRD